MGIRLENLPTGIALATQQLHKAEHAFESGEIPPAMKRHWLRVRDVIEPRGTDDRTLGIGKKQAQRAALDELGSFAALNPSWSWMWLSTDVTMRHFGEQLNKPKGSAWDCVQLRMQRSLVHDQVMTRVDVSNILTTEFYGYENPTWVGARGATLLLPQTLVRWLADGGNIERATSTGNIQPGLVTYESNGALRWDRLPAIWGDLRRDIGAESGVDFTVVADGRTVVVDSTVTAMAATLLLTPYLRGIAPGLVAGAVTVVERYKQRRFLM